MTFDAVSYLASNHFYSSTSNGACSVAQGIGSPMSIVPKTEFGVCEGVNDANFTFQWSPIPRTSNPGFMSSNRVKDVRVSANLTTAKQYQLLVTDTSGVCSKTVTRNISVVSKYNTKPDSLPLQCVKGGIIQLTCTNSAYSFQSWWKMDRTRDYQRFFRLLGSSCIRGR